MSFEPVILFIIALQLRKRFIKNGLYPEYQRYLLYAMIGIGVLVALGFSTPAEEVTKWIWHILILAVMYIFFTREDLRIYRNYMYAFLPLTILEVLKDLLQLGSGTWVETIDHYLDGASVFSFIWMAALLIIANKQKKALDRERLRREQEEREKKLIEEKKSELEVLVAERTSEILKQKEELQQAVVDLKAAQSQLVHAEKMASLGELTAGIAHEIQNPLNFVNNFSEVNTELAAELREELENMPLPQAEKATLQSIAGSIIQNQEKINFHGKRADAIVKGMLQHSRTSTGQKEPVDINALGDEYLRLSYHGLRAKDKLFNARMVTELDPAAGMIQAIPQDLGRALLNFFNNAFYAVGEKKKLNLPGYDPTVTLAIRKKGRFTEIRIADNGIGMPDGVKAKIFQPFFTTKPTGQGTGLGMSLSYDIITKMHGGTISVDSREGEGTEFIIRLPAG